MLSDFLVADAIEQGLSHRNNTNPTKDKNFPDESKQQQPAAVATSMEASAASSTSSLDQKQFEYIHGKAASASASSPMTSSLEMDAIEAMFGPAAQFHHKQAQIEQQELQQQSSSRQVSPTKSRRSVSRSPTKSPRSPSRRAASQQPSATSSPPLATREKDVPQLILAPLPSRRPPPAPVRQPATAADMKKQSLLAVQDRKLFLRRHGLLAEQQQEVNEQRKQDQVERYRERQHALALAALGQQQRAPVLATIIEKQQQHHEKQQREEEEYRARLREMQLPYNTSSLLSSSSATSTMTQLKVDKIDRRCAEVKRISASLSSSSSRFAPRRASAAAATDPAAAPSSPDERTEVSTKLSWEHLTTVPIEEMVPIHRRMNQHLFRF